MALAGGERHQCSRLAFDCLFRGFDRNPSRDHLHERTLANVMIGQALSTPKVEHHDTALGQREQNTWLLAADRRYARRIGPRFALGAFIR